MNPVEFLKVINPSMVNDVVLFNPNKDFSNINKSLYDFILPNDSHMMYKYISDNFKIQKNKRNGMINYFETEVTDSILDPIIKNHLKEHYMYYIFLVLFVGDKDKRSSYVRYMIQQSNSKKDTEQEMKELSMFINNTADFIDNMFNNLKMFFQSPIKEFETNIIHCYMSYVIWMQEIYMSLYNAHESLIQISFKSIGLVPTYWTKPRKMRMRLICDMKGFNSIAANVNHIQPFFPVLHPIQKRENIPKLSTSQMCYYMEYLPDIMFSFIKPRDLLDTFLNALYTKETMFMKPVDARVILCQYLVVHLPRWEPMWRKQNWPINGNLFHNINTYCIHHPLPNIDFWKTILYI